MDHMHHHHGYVILQTIDRLKLFLVRDGIEYTETLFDTIDGIDGLGNEIFVSAPNQYTWEVADINYVLQDSGMRIIIPAMYAVNARPLLCKVRYVYTSIAIHNMQYNSVVLPRGGLGLHPILMLADTKCQFSTF